jgi:hypothetical protein
VFVVEDLSAEGTNAVDVALVVLLQQVQAVELLGTQSTTVFSCGVRQRLKVIVQTVRLDI